jgi:osmotically inducible protein OsmC
MDRKATAVWQGDLRHGKGTLTTESKALSAAPYSFSTRFEGVPGTNPEELLGAAHAGCFTMALTHALGEAGITPERIETQATVTLEKQEAAFTITKVHLDVGIQAPGADAAKVEAAAQKAKANCPLSRVLKAAISMEARLNA